MRPMDSLTDQLTEPQRECLRLVLAHHNSKEIAAKLGISPSAVDKRIERAVQLLGTSSRFAAARMVAAEEGGVGYDRLPSEPIDVPESAPPESEPSGGAPRWFVLRLLDLSSRGRKAGGERVRFGKAQRLALVMALILFVAVTSMVLLNLASTLSTFVERHRAERTR